MIDCLAEYLCNANINGCIHDDCENPMFSGIEERAFIFNKSQFEFVPQADNSNIIARIIPINGAVGYGIVNSGVNPYMGTQTSAVAGDYRNTFTHTVSFYVPMDGADVVRDIIDPLANGRFVIVMKNQFVNANGDNEYMIFGVDRGLRLSDDGSIQQVKYENNDYWMITLTETGVPTANKFFKYNGEADWQVTTTIRVDGVDYDANSITFGKQTVDSVDTYYMQVTLPTGVIVKGIDATFENSVLTFTIDGKKYQATFATEATWTDIDLNNFTVGDWNQAEGVDVMSTADTGEYLCTLINC